MSLASLRRVTSSRTSGSPCTTAILTLALTLAPAPNPNPTLTLTLAPTLTLTLARYDGEPLPGGKQEASRLEQQTHVAYRDGFYVNGLPLAKAYREAADSVSGRGGTLAPILALSLNLGLRLSLRLRLTLTLTRTRTLTLTPTPTLTLTLTLTLALSPILTLTLTLALTLTTLRCAAAAAVPSPTATPSPNPHHTQVRGRGGGAFANCYPRGGTANAEMELRTDAGPALNRIFLRARKRHAVQPAGR